MPNGVEIFFVLSGFLIGQIIFKKIEKGEFKTWRNLLHFWKFRWYRTLPNYFLVLFLTIALAYFHLNNQNIHFLDWKYFFFIQNFAIPMQAFFPESWSLSVEEWFYILFPLALIFAFFAFKKYSTKWVSFWVILLFIGIPIFLKIVAVYDAPFQSKYEWGNEIRKVVLLRLDSIIIGVLFAWFKFYYIKKFVNWRIWLLVFGLLLNILNRVFFEDFETGFTQWSYLVINGFAMAMLLPFFDSIKTGAGPIYKFFTYVSIVSYAMYVMHFSVVLGMLVKHVDVAQPLNAWASYAAYWVATILLSHVLYKYYEKPMTDLRK